MKINTLIFDLGNVVLTNDWHDNNGLKYDEYKATYNISLPDMERGWKTMWPQYQIGKISENQFWKGFLSSAGCQTNDIITAKTLWRKYQNTIDGMLPLLKELKKTYRIFALSNTSKEWMRFKINHFHLHNYFEELVGSGDVGYAKPHMEIYRYLLNEYHIDPKQSLFIDDNSILLPPAEILGIRTILFRNSYQLTNDLLSFGIMVN